MFEQLDDPHPPEFGERHRRGVRTRIRTRQRRKLAIGGAVGAVVIGVGGLGARTALRVDQVRRLEVAGTDATGQLAAGEPVTVLLVGVDGAEQLGADVDDRPWTDSMLLVRLDPAAGAIRVLSLPRDLDVAEVGSPVRRLNSVYAEAGVDGLVGEVEGLGFPVDHVAIVDFVGFRDLVDAIGGVDVAVTAPLRDKSSGLVVDVAGCQRFDGVQALALARARHLERFDAGEWWVDGTGDIGRMERQRALLLAAFVQLGRQIPDPLTVDRLAGWAQEHLTVDSGLGNTELVGLIRSAAAIDPGRVESIGLPVSPETRDGNSVLRALGVDGVAEWFGDGTPAPDLGTATTSPDRSGANVPSPDAIGPC